MMYVVVLYGAPGQSGDWFTLPLGRRFRTALPLVRGPLAPRVVHNDTLPFLT